jgi:hypothetical protein
MGVRDRRAGRQVQHESVSVETKVTVRLTLDRVREILRAHVGALARDGKAPPPEGNIEVNLFGNSDDEFADPDSEAAIMTYLAARPAPGAH